MTFNEEITIKVWRHAKSAARFRSLRSYYTYKIFLTAYTLKRNSTTSPSCIT